MSVREYIGARYIPLFADPIDWDQTLEYEPLTVVVNSGSSYVSRRWVPAGISIDNTDYWLLWADYNAQIAAYRAEVQTFDGRITANANDIDAIEAIIPSSAFTAQSTVEDALNGLQSDIEDELNGLSSTVTALSAILNLAISQFDTFAQFAASTALEAGRIYMTRGYSAPYDGGAGIYATVNASSALTVATASTGVYAMYVPQGSINAAALGCVGTTSSDSISRVFAYSETMELPVEFPAAIETSSTINIGSHPVTFSGDVTYSGIDYAIEIKDPGFSNSTQVAFNRIDATNGSGILVHQFDSDYTITNPRITGSRIEAAKHGLTLQSDTWGILEGEINVGRIRAGMNALQLICKQEDAQKTSFIGQMVFNITQLYADGKAIYMECPANATITGIYFGPISFENCGSGWECNAVGAVKMIDFQSLRCLETISKFVKISGDIRNVHIHAQSPMRIDLVDIATTNTFSNADIIIDGGIYSPSSYRFADSALFWYSSAAAATQRTFKWDKNVGQNQSTNFTFGSASTQWRCYREFRNNSSTNREIRNLEYFHPFGIDTIYLNQNKTNGATYTLYDMDGNIIFDGTSRAESGRNTYKIRCMWDGGGSVGVIKYAIDVVAGTTT